jgi:hypothetical protein
VTGSGTLGELGLRLVQGALRATRDDDAGTRGDETFGDREAEAVTSSGDERRAPFEHSWCQLETPTVT